MILLVAGVTIYMGTEFGAEEALIAALGGTVVGALYLGLIFLGMLNMYAFGELVQTNIEQKKVLDQLLAEAKTAPAPVQAASVPKREAAPVEPEPVPVNACPNCGTELDAGVNFCRNCGTKVNG